MRRLRRREQPGDELYRCPRCKGKGPWVWGLCAGCREELRGALSLCDEVGRLSLPE